MRTICRIALVIELVALIALLFVGRNAQPLDEQHTSAASAA